MGTSLGGDVGLLARGELVAAALAGAGHGASADKFIILGPDGVGEVGRGGVGRRVEVPERPGRHVSPGPDHTTDGLPELGVVLRGEHDGAHRLGAGVLALVDVAVGVRPHTHFTPQEQVSLSCGDGRRNVVPAVLPPVRSARHGPGEVKVGPCGFDRAAAGGGDLARGVAAPSIDDTVGLRSPRVEQKLLPSRRGLAELLGDVPLHLTLDREGAVSRAAPLLRGLVAPDVEDLVAEQSAHLLEQLLQHVHGRVLRVVVQLTPVRVGGAELNPLTLDGEETTAVPGNVKLRDHPDATVRGVLDELLDVILRVVSAHDTREGVSEVGVQLGLDAEAAVVRCVQVEDVHLYPRHRVQQVLKEGEGEEAAAGVDHETPPVVHRRV
eukprot:Hpha_TRINITY_DN9793_c0_g1::TRINITY_DN9793_c0_g1_i1::g.10456::m.10456